MYALILPLAVVTIANTTVKSDDDERAWWSAIGGSASLESVVGIGTFVSGNKNDDPYYSSTLSLAPSWKMDEDSALSLALSLTYEWTYLITPCHPASGPRPTGAPAEDCSDTADPNGRRGDIDDLTLGYSHGKIIELFGVRLTGDASLAFPTSRGSRAARNLFTLGGGLGLSRALGPVTPSLSWGFAKFFPRTNADSRDAIAAVQGDIPIGQCPSFRNTNCILLSGFVPTWRTSIGVSVAADIVWVDGLSVSTSFSYAYSRRHGTGGDALSSTKTDADGKPIVDGVNESDTTSGTIEISYAILDELSVSGGVSSAQPAKSARGNIRFPFFDFISPANNYTGFYVSLAYAR